MIGITEYLQQIYEDFREEIEYSGDTLCELKKLSFEAGGLPNYNNIQIQRLYLLRYAFSYAFEYTKMYEEVLEDMNDPTEISVASIGCGNMIDYWALVQALDNKWNLDCNVRYVGIDEIDWQYRVDSRLQDEIHYLVGNAKQCFTRAQQLVSDVYFFPKSISEFSDEEMNAIADAFRTKKIERDTIYLCISIRKNGYSQEIDIHRTQQIYNALLQSGFVANCNYTRYTYYPSNTALYLCDNNYIYPNEALEYLKHLSEKCKTYVEMGDNCYNGCGCLNRQPVLKNGMICYQVIKFERT